LAVVKPERDPQALADTIERVKFDLDYLKAHEVKEPPERLRRFLFVPKASPMSGPR